MGKTSFVINTASRSTISMCKICHNKTRSSDFSNYFIIYFPYILLLVDYDRFVSGLHYRRYDARFPRRFHRIVKPHEPLAK